MAGNTRSKAHAGLARFWGGDGTGIGAGKSMKAGSRKIALAQAKKVIPAHIAANRRKK